MVYGNSPKEEVNDMYLAKTSAEGSYLFAARFIIIDYSDVEKVKP